MHKEKILGALDLGPQAVQLLLLKYTQDDKFETVGEFVAVTRLCDGLSHTNSLSESAIERSVQAAVEMRTIAIKEGVDDLIVTANSAIREANNRSKFLVKCHLALNIYPQLLNGIEEARFSYLGARSDLPTDQAALVLEAGYRTVRAAFGQGEDIHKAVSMPCGAMLLEEQLGPDWQHSILKQKTAHSIIKKDFGKFEEDFTSWAPRSETTVIVCGDLATSYAAFLKHEFYDRQELNSTVSNIEELSSACKHLAHLSLPDRTAIQGMDRDSAEALPSGLFILTVLLRSLGMINFRVSTAGFRWGILKSFMKP
ncbi:MAG: hypothetical protein A2X49_07890 [Lentisphaerae bacterium GWF2_52_8]|nr:MAG: hypothetical protein A2X49_07890 [Lentisphaerae bacterium GWF2_52_8]